MNRVRFSNGLIDERINHIENGIVNQAFEDTDDSSIKNDDS